MSHGVLLLLWQDEKCNFNPNTVGATDTGYVDIPSGNEEKLTDAVATVGPISVAIDASHMSFQVLSSDRVDCFMRLKKLVSSLSLSPSLPLCPCRCTVVACTTSRPAPPVNWTTECWLWAMALMAARTTTL